MRKTAAEPLPEVVNDNDITASNIGIKLSIILGAITLLSIVTGMAVWVGSMNYRILNNDAQIRESNANLTKRIDAQDTFLRQIDESVNKFQGRFDQVFPPMRGK